LEEANQSGLINLVGASAISGFPFLDGKRMFTSILSQHWPGCFSALGRGVSRPWMVGIDFVIGHWQFGQCERWPIFLHSHISIARKVPQAQIEPWWLLNLKPVRFVTQTLMSYASPSKAHSPSNALPPTMSCITGWSRSEAIRRPRQEQASFGRSQSKWSDQLGWCIRDFWVSIP